MNYFSLLLFSDLRLACELTGVFPLEPMDLNIFPRAAKREELDVSSLPVLLDVAVLKRLRISEKEKLLFAGKLQKK